MTGQSANRFQPGCRLSVWYWVIGNCLAFGVFDIRISPFSGILALLQSVCLNQDYVSPQRFWTRLLRQNSMVVVRMPFKVFSCSPLCRTIPEIRANSRLTVSLMGMG